MSRWAALVVDHLVQRRSEGWTFERAWQDALVWLPARGADASAATPRLFEEDGSRPDTIVAFHKRVCENAWHDRVDKPGSGNGPKLRHFRVELLRDLDMSTRAGKRTGARQSRLAA